MDDSRDNHDNPVSANPSPPSRSGYPIESGLARFKETIGAPKVSDLQMWWSQSQIDYMRANAKDFDFYRSVVESHDRIYHFDGEARPIGCCLGVAHV